MVQGSGPSHGGLRPYWAGEGLVLGEAWPIRGCAVFYQDDTGMIPMGDNSFIPPPNLSSLPHKKPKMVDSDSNIDETESKDEILDFMHHNIIVKDSNEILTRSLNVAQIEI